MRSITSLNDWVDQCTVKLTMPGGYWRGTGFFVAPGLIVTCAHVVKSEKEVLVTWQSQDIGMATIEELRSDPAIDLALLKLEVPDRHQPPCVLLDEQFESRHELYIFGYAAIPSGEPLVLDCSGRGFFNEQRDPFIKLQDGQVTHGYSGSAVLNQSTGKVCGVLTETLSDVGNYGGLAIPAEVLFREFPGVKQKNRIFHEKDRRWREIWEAQSGKIVVPRSRVFKLPQRPEIKKFLGDRALAEEETTSDNKRLEILETLERVLVSEKKGKAKPIVFLTGKAGIGKSTLAYYFANKCKGYATRFNAGIVGVRMSSDEDRNGEDAARQLINTLTQYQLVNVFKPDNGLSTLNENDSAINQLEYLFSSEVEDKEDENDTKILEGNADSKKELLIIFDNADESVIPILSALFANNTQNECAVIVTTRIQSLHETVKTEGGLKKNSISLEIPKFEASESLVLFKAFLEEETLDEKEDAAAREICQAVDHLPLAIRISGRAFNALKKSYRDDVERYYQEIDNYLSTLSDADPKMRLDRIRKKNSVRGKEDYDWSVEASLNLSLDFLKRNNKDEIIHFFESLGICAEGGFYEETAGITSGCDRAATAEYLAYLCDLSLLDKTISDPSFLHRAEGARSYYVLHPLIHSLALSRIQATPERLKEAKERHARFFLERIRKFSAESSRFILEQDEQNVLKAVSWLGEDLSQTPEIKTLKHARGGACSRSALLSAKLPPPDGLETYEYWKSVANGLNLFFEAYPHPQEAADMLSVFQKLAEQVGDWPFSAECQIREAKFYQRNGDLEKAEDAIKPVGKAIRKIASREALLKCQNKWELRFGIILQAKGELRLASEYLTLSVKSAKRSCRSALRKESLLTYLPFFSTLDRQSAAVADYKSSRRLLRNSLLTRAAFLFRQSRLELAIKDYRSATLLHEDISDKGYESCLINEYFLLRLVDREEEAKILYDYCITDVILYRTDQRQTAVAFHRVGKQLEQLGHLDLAVEAYKQQIEMNEVVGDKRLVATSSIHLGLLLKNQERYDESFESLQRSLKYGDFLDERAPVVQTIRRLSAKFRNERNFDKARDAIQVVIAYSRTVNDWQTLASALNILGWIYKELDSVDDAIQAFAEQGIIAEQHNDRSQHRYSTVALIALMKLQPKPTRKALQRCIRERQSSDQLIYLLRKLLYVGRTLQSQGEKERAVTVAELVARNCESYEDTEARESLLVLQLFDLSKLYIGKNELKKGLTAVQKLYDISIEREDLKRNLSFTLLHIGKLLKSKGEFDSAVDLLQKQNEISASTEGQPKLVNGLMVIGSILQQQGNLEEALQKFTEAAQNSSDAAIVEPVLWALKNIGLQLQSTARLDAAEEAFEGLIQLSEVRENMEMSAIGHSCLGIAKRENGKPGEAIYHFLDHIEISKKLNNSQQVGFGVVNLGKSLAKIDSTKVSLLDRDKDLFDKVLSDLRESYEVIQDKIPLRSLNSLGVQLYQGGRLLKALQIFELSAQLVKSRKDRHYLQKNIEDLADALMTQSYYEDALNATLLALRINSTFDSWEGLTWKLIDIGKAFHAQNRWQKAQTAFEQAIEICRANNSIKMEALGYGLLGTLLQDRRELESALYGFISQTRLCEQLVCREQPSYKLLERPISSSSLFEDALERLSDFLLAIFKKAFKDLKKVVDAYERTAIEDSDSTELEEQLLRTFSDFVRVFRVDEVIESRQLITESTTLNSLQTILKRRTPSWNVDWPYLLKVLDLTRKLEVKTLSMLAYSVVGQLLQWKKNYSKIAKEYISESILLATSEDFPAGQRVLDRCLAQNYRAHSRAYLSHKAVSKELIDQSVDALFKSFELEEKSGSISGIEIVAMLGIRQLRRVSQKKKALVLCRRALSVTPGSSILQASYARLGQIENKRTSLPQEFASRREKLRFYDRHAAIFEKAKHGASRQGEWFLRTAVVDGWVLSAWVYRCLSNRFEIAFFLENDCFLFERKEGVLSALLYALSDAYFFTGEMSLHFLGREGTPYWQTNFDERMQEGFEPKVPSAMVRTIQNLGIDIQANARSLSSETGREVYLKIAKLSDRVAAFCLSNDMDPVHVAFLLNRGVWTLSQVHLFMRYAHRPTQVINGTISLARFASHQHDFLLVRIGLMAALVGRGLSSLNDVAPCSLQQVWIDVNKQILSSENDLQLETTSGTHIDIPSNTSVLIVYLCQTDYNYTSFVRRHLPEVPVGTQIIFTVTKDFGLFDESVRSILTNTINGYVIKLPHTLRELSKKAQERLLSASRTQTNLYRRSK